MTTQPTTPAALAPRPVVGVFVFRGDSVLLMRHVRGACAGQWIAPGGKVEPGEACADAVRRELREETGLVADDVRPAGFWDDHFGADRQYVILWYVATCSAGDPANAEPDKCDGMRFFPLAELPEPVSPREIDALRRMRRLPANHSESPNSSPAALAATLAAHDAAMTPGRWVASASRELSVAGGDSLAYATYDAECNFGNEADAAGIAALRNALPEIVRALAEADAARRLLARALSSSLPTDGMPLAELADLAARRVVMLGAEVQSLTTERDAFEAAHAAVVLDRALLATAAHWLASNAPGTPVPDWVDHAVNCRPADDVTVLIPKPQATEAHDPG